MKKNKYVLLFFIFALALFSLSFFIIDPDYLWHIKAGEYIYRYGLLTKDVFSWSVRSEYWMSHEWLFEVILYHLKHLFGNLHLFVYCFICIASLLFTIYVGNKKKLYNNLFFTIIWFTCSLILIFVMQGRPHMISNCLLALTIYFLYDLYQNENSKKIYFLPIVSVFWSNVHGGSSNLPYLLCILFMIAGTFRFRFSKIEAKRLTKKQYLKYFCIMLCSMICVCINIHGFKMFIYPYQNMLDTTMLQNISEWRSTSLSEPTHYIYYALLLFIVCIFLFSKKKIDFVDFILFGFCTYLGLKSIRFWFYTYIIMSFVVFSYIGKREEDKGTSIALIALSCLFIFMFATRGSAILHPSYHFLLTASDIQEVKKEDPERLFNMYDYGGDLIYRDVLVFIDGRADLYGKHNYKDYLSIASLEGDYVSLIQQYDFDYFLVDKNYPIATYLKYDDTYDLIYSRGDVYFYKKRTNS